MCEFFLFNGSYFETILIENRPGETGSVETRQNGSGREYMSGLALEISQDGLNVFCVATADRLNP